MLTEKERTEPPTSSSSALRLARLASAMPDVWTSGPAG